MIIGQNDLKAYFVTADRGVAEAATATPTRSATACVVLNIQQRDYILKYVYNVVVKEVHVQYLIC